MSEPATVAASMLLFVVYGCSSTPSLQVQSSQVHGFTAADLETYSWRPVEELDPGDPDDVLIAIWIEEAVNRSLSELGFRRVDSDPDFVVHYHAAVEGRVDSQTTLLGHPEGETTYAGLTTTQREFQQGTLIVDLMRPSDEGLLWRGWATDAVSEDPNSEEIKQSIDRAVEEIFRQFPSS